MPPKLATVIDLDPQQLMSEYNALYTAAHDVPMALPALWVVHEQLRQAADRGHNRQAARTAAAQAAEVKRPGCTYSTGPSLSPM